MAFFIPSYINTMVNIYLRITVKQTFYDNINILRIRYVIKFIIRYFQLVQNTLTIYTHRYNETYLHFDFFDHRRVDAEFAETHVC